jgi:hypothetical protein
VASVRSDPDCEGRIWRPDGEGRLRIVKGRLRG